MYLPSFNRTEDRAAIRDFIHANGFATLITQCDGKPWASHLPVLLEESASGDDLLRSHMARANEQWQHFATNQEVLCIFHGPHSYISPSWYENKIAVPTWNYATVHIYGRAQLVRDPAALKKIVVDTTSKYEAEMENPWKIMLPDEKYAAMLGAIVGFEIRVSKLEAKFKLGQNKTREDRAGMLAGLAASENPGRKALAEFMKAHAPSGE